LPAYPQGAMALEGNTVLQGAKTLRFTGGRYFQFFGFGSSAGGMSTIIATYNNPDLLMRAFYGESEAALLGSVFVGDYSAWDQKPGKDNCQEYGSMVAAINPSGNANLSGVWTLRVDALCAETVNGMPLVIGETIGNPVPPHQAGQPISVFQTTLPFAFSAYPFINANGDPFDIFMGMSMGPAGFFAMASGSNTAQLAGFFDPDTSVLAGQLLGKLPAPGGSVCTVQTGKGSFVAIIDRSVIVPQPPH